MRSLWLTSFIRYPLRSPGACLFKTSMHQYGAPAFIVYLNLFSMWVCMHVCACMCVHACGCWFNGTGGKQSPRENCGGYPCSKLKWPVFTFKCPSRRMDFGKRPCTGTPTCTMSHILQTTTPLRHLHTILKYSFFFHTSLDANPYQYPISALCN